MRVLNSVASILFALLLLLSFSLSPHLALAQQPAGAVSVPRIDGFSLIPAAKLSAGNQLTFTLHGTPGGTASASISGVPTRILLDEVETGMYEGSYTIKKGDRIAATSAVTVNLRLGNQIATEILDEPLLAGARLPANRTPVSTTTPSIVSIESFVLDPPPRLLPGEQLFFTLHGTPAGNASVRIGGVKGKFLLNETKSGTYEGTYTIKKRDRIVSGAIVTATLHLGNRDVSANLDQPLLVASTNRPSAQGAARICANCGVIEAINVVEVKGKGSYIGKIGGGVVGGLLGSQVGKGRATTVAEIAGAVGGAVLGNEIEKRVVKTKHYDVIIRLQGGGAQTETYSTIPAFKVGDRVKVENGVLMAD
jgi:outer membrane lipoprotein SlyB